MQTPKFTLNDIKYATSKAIYKRACDLCASGKVKEVDETENAYSAKVEGTQSYHVSLTKSRIDNAHCDCYMGQNDLLCKHVLSLGLFVLHASGKMEESTSQPNAATELSDVKHIVTDAFKKIKPYRGPSRIWFNYQRDLATGAGTITDAISALLPTKENARYLWQLIERIDRKLMNGVDDSDGVVGDCASNIINQLAKYAHETPELKSLITNYTDKKTNFCFENELRQRLECQTL